MSNNQYNNYPNNYNFNYNYNPYNYQYPNITNNIDQNNPYQNYNYQNYMYYNNYNMIQPQYPIQNQTYPLLNNNYTQNVIPKPSKHYCSNCQKSFPSYHHYQTHMKAHINCNIDGCNFSAIEKILEIHQQNIHHKIDIPNKKEKTDIHISNSLLELIPKKYRYVTELGNTKEDIDKWIKERKSHYPTKNNIQKKVEEKAEKRARGIPDDENEKKRRKTKDSDIKLPRTVLNKDNEIICGYFFKGKCRLGKKCQYKHDQKYKLCNYFVNGTCKKGEKCNLVHDESYKDMIITKKIDDNKREIIEKEKKSLLSKLLSKDKHKENIILLQCLNYIYQNNYLK